MLHPLFVSLKRRSGKEKVWSFDYRNFSAPVKRVFEMAGLGGANIHPHMLRHGGASDDALRQTRAMIDIKRRGRWAADSSVKRYEKHARVLKSLENLPNQVRDYGNRIANRLGDHLDLSVLAPAPPGAINKKLHSKK